MIMFNAMEICLVCGRYIIYENCPNRWHKMCACVCVNMCWWILKIIKRWEERDKSRWKPSKVIQVRFNNNPSQRNGWNWNVSAHSNMSSSTANTSHINRNHLQMWCILIVLKTCFNVLQFTYLRCLFAIASVWNVWYVSNCLNGWLAALPIYCRWKLLSFDVWLVWVAHFIISLNSPISFVRVCGCVHEAHISSDKRIVRWSYQISRHDIWQKNWMLRIYIDNVHILKRQCKVYCVVCTH